MQRDSVGGGVLPCIYRAPAVRNSERSSAPSHRQNRRRHAIVACAAVTVLLILAGPAAAEPPSKLVTAPETGAAIVTNGEFTNLYLWPDPETESWNAHLEKLAKEHPGEIDEAAMTGTINGLTTTLVGSSYFDLLTQYTTTGGAPIEPPTFVGEQTTSPECMEQVRNNEKENGGVIQWEGLSKFVGCERSHSAIISPQVNLFVSPELKVGNANPVGGHHPSICGSGETGYHTTDLEVANFSVIPIDKKCNKTLVSVGETIGHEMTEILSDPALFGYIDESVAPRALAGNFQQDYGQGELADICQEKGLHPTATTKFETGFGTLEVGPYWSNADANCEPRRIMNTTLAEIVGTSKLPDGSEGLVRLTGKKGEKEIPIPLVEPTGLKKHFLQALELEIRTGGDNLNGGNGPEDGAFVALKFKGETKPLLLEHINEGQSWANNKLHAVLLEIPSGESLEDLEGLTVFERFNGNDNWDIKNVTVKAAVACAVVTSRGCGEEPEPVECTLAHEKTGAPPPKHQPDPLIDIVGTKLLEDGHHGLARLTEKEHEVTVKAKPQFAFKNLVVSKLTLKVKTGDDNLRAGALPGENADAILNLDNGTHVVYTDINQRSEWSNLSESGEIPLPISSLPPGTTLDDISSVTIATNFHGDNWDILGLRLRAETTCTGGPHPLPKAVEVADVEEVGHTELEGGAIGLRRFKGGNSESFSVPVTPPSAANAGKTVTGLQLIVGTSGDNLRGGFAPQDNASASLVVGGSTVTFSDINVLEEWANETTNSVALLTLNGLPAGTKLGEITGPLTITTNLPGGSEGDNWDLASLKLIARAQ